MPRNLPRGATRADHLRTHDASADYVITPAPTTWIDPGPVPKLTTTDPGKLFEAGLGSVVIDRAPRTIDHVAIVLETPSQVHDLVAKLERRGSRVVEEPQEFPSVECETPLPWQLHKHMASVELSTGVLVVSSPLRHDDQLDQHLRTFGTRVPHHLAVLVDDIVNAVDAWSGRGYRFGAITDDGDLAQVFGTSTHGTLIELISRRDPRDQATFSCGNIAALSAAEAALRSEA